MPDIYHCAADALHSRNGYWLTKRRDGRSSLWMIARYQGRNRSTVYRSCRTSDLGAAVKKLEAFAAANPTGEVPLPNRRANVVYFIRAATGQIKIGIAQDAGRRLASLRTMSPVALEFAAVVVGGQELEYAYHQRFAAHRLHGEWFAPHPDILAEIDRLNGAPA